MPATHNCSQQATVHDATPLSNPNAQAEARIASLHLPAFHLPSQNQISERFTLPRASGMTAVYINLYRQWLDKAEPDHHLMLINRRARGKHDRYVRLAVHCKALNIKIEDEFIYRDELSLENAKAQARVKRAQLQDELFCLARRIAPEVPSIYNYPKQQCYKVDITTSGKRQFKTFSYRYSPQHEAYDRGVKALFDVWAIEYPEYLFTNPWM